MRPAPGPIPTKLPSITDVARMVQRAVDRPNIRIGDRSIGQLVEELNDGTPAWLTGSNVWMPAVFGQPLEPMGDYDVVFATQEAASRFVRNVVGELNRRLPREAGRYTVGNTMLGQNGRILHPDGTGVIDAWSLGEHESIGELLMGYPHPYQRAAYYLSRSPSPGCVFRIACDGEAERDRKESLFGRIKEARVVSGYPGRRR